jgi:hypothetical protein
MSTSIRELIIQNIQTSVRNVRKSNGYDNDLPSGSVHRALASINNMVFPCVMIFEGDEKIVEREYSGTNTKVVKDFDITIEILTTDWENLSTTVNSLEADVLKAIMADTTRNSYALTTEEQGSNPFFQEGTDIGGRALSIKVRYLHKETDPYTQ